MKKLRNKSLLEKGMQNIRTLGKPHVSFVYINIEKKLGSPWELCTPDLKVQRGLSQTEKVNAPEIEFDLV
jgi:hypothetical protein